jgi:hypothetical protein
MNERERQLTTEDMMRISSRPYIVSRVILVILSTRIGSKRHKKSRTHALHSNLPVYGVLEIR